jgi:CRP/FNR family transcriptional regulator, cyclic AMP receptor protein
MPEIRSYSEVLMHLDDQPRSYAEGQVIFEECEPAAEMYIVRQGTVTLKKGDRSFETLGPGEVFGEMALIDPAPRSATAVAGQGCLLAVVDEKTFQQVVQQVPGFALELARLMARRLRKDLTR